MATVSPPPRQVQRQLATRSHGPRIALIVGLILLAGIAACVLLFRQVGKGRLKEIAAATTLRPWVDKGEYSVPQQAALVTPDTPVDHTAEELARMRNAMLAMQMKLDELDKRKQGTTIVQQGQAESAAKAPEKRAAPMLYLHKDLKDEPQGTQAKGAEYTIMPGYFIPCMIETAMNSDTGDITFTAVTTAIVYDTATGRYPLIMQGSKIVGEGQGSQLVYGNELLRTVSLTLSRRQDTAPIDLGQAPLTDHKGINGLASRVNTHFWRNLAAVFIGGALRGGMQAIQTSIATAGGAGQVAAGISSVGNQVVTQKVSKAIDTRPTIEVDPGQGCNILIVKPLRLSVSYE